MMLLRFKSIDSWALALLENRRYKIYQEQKGSSKRITASEKSELFKDKIDAVKKDVDTIIDNIRSSENISEEVKEAVDNIEEFIDFSQETSVALDEMLNHNRVLTGLATLGITSAVLLMRLKLQLRNLILLQY